MYVCVCRAVTNRDLAEAMAQGHQTLPALQSTLGVATGCGRCRGHVCQMLERVSDMPFAPMTTTTDRCAVSAG